MKIRRNSKVDTIILSLGGLSAGFINGLLGTGGGILIVLILSKLNSKGDAKDNFAMAVASILPVSVVSAGFYLKGGSFSITYLFPYILPAIAGGVLGAVLLCKIKTQLLKKIFACILIFAGVNMII